MGRYKEWIREGNGGKCGQITLYAYIKMPQWNPWLSIVKYPNKKIEGGSPSVLTKYDFNYELIMLTCSNVTYKIKLKSFYFHFWWTEKFGVYKTLNMSSYMIAELRISQSYSQSSVSYLKCILFYLFLLGWKAAKADSKWVG
jgi:hypothetical protein